MAHKLAIANAHITADVIEITEFPELAQRHNIYGVPKSVIAVQDTEGAQAGNEVEVEGALPEQQFVQAVMRAVQAQDNGQAADGSGQGEASREL